MIKLKQKDVCTTSRKEEFNWGVLDDSFVLWRDFRGKKLKPEEFRKFQEEVNQHRAYCASDFTKQHFISDLTKR